MTEALPQVSRPNVWERLKTNVQNGWDRLTGALGRGRDRVQDFAVEARAFVGAGVQGARDRVEAVVQEVRGDFNGGVRETFRNLGETIRNAGGSLWERVRGIGRGIQERVEGVKARCDELGVAQGLVSKFRDGIDRIRELPADFADLRMRIEENKASAMLHTVENWAQEGVGDERVVERFGKVGGIIIERHDALEERSRCLRERVGALQQARHRFEDAKAENRRIKAEADRRAKAQYQAVVAPSAA